MAKQRQYTTVRTDSTESTIAHYLAQRNYEAAEAIRHFAHKAGIPISEKNIKREAIDRCRVMSWEVPPHLQEPEQPEVVETALPEKRPVGRPPAGSSWIETHKVTGKNGKEYTYKRRAWYENGKKKTKVIK